MLVMKSHASPVSQNDTLNLHVRGGLEGTIAYAAVEIVEVHTSIGYLHSITLLLEDD